MAQAYVMEDTLLPMGFLAICVVAATLFLFKRNDHLPLQNGKAPMELLYTNAKARFLVGAADMLKSGFGKARKSFFLMTDTGPRYIVPPEYAQELQNHRNLTSDGIIDERLQAHIPGLEVFQFDSYHGKLARRTIRKKLRGPPLEGLTLTMVKETGLTIAEICTDNPEWREIGVRDIALPVLSRVFTAAFLGEELSRNKDWLRKFGEYSTAASLAAEQLRFWPEPLRPLVHWVLPTFRKLRSDLTETCNMVASVLQQRKTDDRGMGPREGYPTFVLEDWLDELSGGKEFDPALIHMTLFVVGVHTASDMLTQVIYDLCDRDELVNDIRNEITAVIAEDGELKKGSMDKLKLLDSVMKESQRLKPANIAAMGRKANKDFILPDGTRIFKGEQLLVPGFHMWDESFYPNPQEFVPDRFLKMRQSPGQEDLHQCVSTSANHLGFGHGVHACPGRFFAVHQLKITSSAQAWDYVSRQHVWKDLYSQTPGEQSALKQLN
ncbi:hypothetical protein FE257_002679 [Aspergillus nanangensis]|uniref:Cytochrome P450 monooxygenase n=1 Tax=Aspergillus nanangensis TaxID=2582783 RepID=A0AAD4GNY6_ASPNN|nr:hypothetical protein FE257_002679 [Aspergillus nanangensis]